MRWLYNVFFLVFFVLSLPYYFLRMYRRGNWQKGLGQRFGSYDGNLHQALTNRHVIWLHAVSVGEMGVCVALVRALQPRFPNAKIVVSTTTTTGMAELQKRLPPGVAKIYYPIDRHKYVSRAISAISPDAIILVEGEIWPNFIWRANRSRLPLFLVNARLSDRSYRRYVKCGFLFRKLFGSFAGVGAQTQEYAAKLREVGCRTDAVRVLGNLKFDTAQLDGKAVDVPGLLGQVGVGPQALVLVCGSTHDGEEVLLAEQYLRLRARFPNLFLVLVPRHFERARAAGRDLEERGLKLFYRSEITSATRLAPGAIDCLVVNTTGELMRFYARADVAFVGKSLTAKGGQNPIEPAALGKPTLFGPNMQNFRDVARIFTSQHGAIQVRDAAELERVLGELLADPARRRQLGETAARIVRENQGAIRRTVEMIVPALAARDLYVTEQRG